MKSSGAQNEPEAHVGSRGKIVPAGVQCTRSVERISAKPGALADAVDVAQNTSRSRTTEGSGKSAAITGLRHFRAAGAAACAVADRAGPSSRVNSTPTTSAASSRSADRRRAGREAIDTAAFAGAAARAGMRRKIEPAAQDSRCQAPPVARSSPENGSPDPDAWPPGAVWSFRSHGCLVGRPGRIDTGDSPNPTPSIRSPGGVTTMDITTTGRRRTATALATGVTAALALATVAVPGALAQPADPVHTAAADLAHAERGSSTAADLRTPDAVDAAEGSARQAGPTVSPVTVVRTGHGGGFDWGDAAIGAGGTIAAIALSGVAATALTRRRVHPPTPSNAADAAL